jgi:hypothetical protein
MRRSRTLMDEHGPSAIGYRLSAIGYVRVSHPMRRSRTLMDEHGPSAIGYRLFSR